MSNNIKKALYFLCLIDGDQINIPDIAFLIILAKIIAATSVDWPSLATLAIAVLNSCHSRQTISTPDITNMTQQIQNLENIVTQIKAEL